MKKTSEKSSSAEKISGNKKSRPYLRDKAITATVLMIATIAVLYLFAYVRISAVIKNRCLERMEEGINTIMTEITEKLDRESRMLNAVADILTAASDFDAETIQETLSIFTPLLETMKIHILLPDNTVIQAGKDGVTDASGILSFEELSAQGEHISNRMTSVMDGNTLILRHYVPIKKGEKTRAILYGVTTISELPETINVNNIYNASASAFIMDMENGDMIMDTWHAIPGTIYDFEVRKTRGITSWEKELTQIMSGRKGYVIFQSDLTGEWMYFYYSPSRINRWLIAVAVPEKEAFANLFAIRQILWHIAALTAIAVTLYYLWVRKNARETLDKAVEKAVLEEKLLKAEAAERAKTKFLSNMSHDIRTPMNAIIGFATLAETNIDKKERVQEYLAKILSSGNHLLSLINDILDMSRIESGRLHIEEKECSLSEIFRDMRNIIQTQMQSKQLNFYMDTIDVIDEDIYCDKLHVNQILLNLLGNAIKFTPAGGSVALTVRQKPVAPSGYGSYEIRVRDTGIGMSSEFARHVFEPFEREKTSTVSGIQGTGLGMAITKNIIDTMGGTIELKTEEGKGTEFIINLEFRLQKGTRKAEIVRELDGLRALVADDNFDSCDSITKMLSRIGMRPEWTLHGKEAVLRAKQAVEMGDSFYVYVIDGALSDLSGIETARQIRAAVGSDLPIILLTAYDWTVFEEDARAAGVTAFCSKPVFISELRKALVGALRRETPPEKEPPLPAPAENRKEKRLLLVEDNELNREIAVEILSESGYIVETAEDGSIAVEIMKNAAPGYYDLILMDIQMPVMNGYDAARAIRALGISGISEIPIVAMTANAFDDDQRAAMESGMNAHVAKPIDVTRLLDVLSSLLNGTCRNAFPSLKT